jgi:uncharacterized membrane protein
LTDRIDYAVFDAVAGAISMPAECGAQDAGRDMIRKDTHQPAVDVGVRQPDINDITKRNVELIAQMEAAFDQRRSVGDRVADLVATWVGSWTFLIAQSILLVTWMALNIVAWRQHWDPYPFILLNLVLSFQAAFATPIILMSQNRQGRLNERRNHLDLQINLLAEQENTEQLRLLRLLCAKAGIGQEGPGQALEETTRPDDIFRQIGETADIKNHGRSSA